jgi:hypothetical protein
MKASSLDSNAAGSSFDGSGVAVFTVLILNNISGRVGTCAHTISTLTYLGCLSCTTSALGCVSR